MRLFRRLTVLPVAICLMATCWSFAYAQDQGIQYFPETGHNVQGQFLRFYNAFSDPTTLYGYPITEQFQRKDGLLVQYFQRARFEYHPELPEGQQVTLTDLGTQIYTPGSQLSIDNPFACRLYPETNFSVCFAFLDFYDKFGGASQFGYPISPFEYRDGIIVQYFQKARMEWRPSNPEGERVVLTDLGSLYFDKLAEDPGLKNTVQPLNASIQAPILAIQVRAFVGKATTAGSDQQTLYLIAYDQRGKAIQNSACTASIHWPDGSIQGIRTATNADGIAIIRFSFVNKASGNLVPIDIQCANDNVSGGTVTSFRTWY